MRIFDADVQPSLLLFTGREGLYIACGLFSPKSPENANKALALVTEYTAA